jgi:chemotaxis protein CheD
MHIALPESSTNPQKSKLLPYYFVDSALVALMELAEKYKLNLYACEFKAAGGSNMSSPAAASQITTSAYDIGRRNIEALEIGMRNWGLSLKAKQLGGNISRNMSLELKTGKVLVYNTQNRWEL